MTDLKKRKVSELWNFFEPIDKSLATCNMCGKKLSYKTSTSNLKKHMRSKHPTLLLSEEVSIPIQEIVVYNEQPSISSSTPLQSSIKPRKKKFRRKQHTIQCKIISKTSAQPKDYIDKKLLGLFIKDLQPFSAATDEGFTEFVQALNPSYEIPGRHVISKTFISEAYEECLNNTKAIIKKAETFCITTDTWTSMNTTNFIGVTAHFLDDEFNLKSILLDCCTVPEVSHTATNLANAIQKIINDWKIDEKRILLTVTDNAGNTKKAIETKLKWKHFGCLAHTVNSIVKDSLAHEPIQIILNKIRDIVSHVKRSYVANDKLETYQINDSRTPFKLLQDDQRRWNSMYYMIERFLELEEAIKTTLVLLYVNLPTLENSEWQTINELYQILKPFEHITNTISGEGYCTASLVLPILSGLNDVVVTLNSKHWSDLSEQVLLLLLNSLSERLGNTEQNNILSICTFLDPRFKTIPFSSATKIASVKKLIIEAVALKISEDNTVKIEYVSASEADVEVDEYSIWYSFDKQVSESQSRSTSTSRAITEVQRYLQDPVISRHQDPLLWWNTNKVVYPHLALVAQEYLCCLASSVPCERLFSKSGQAFSGRRNRLNENETKMLLFLNVNTKL